MNEKKTKILVIDDEKPTLSMFKLFLTAYGYEVFTAEEGETGLALFKKVLPEIVFTDIKMPGIDGLEVLRRIRQTNIAAEVIIITGHGDMGKALSALDLNASDFINKPVERQALNSALARAEKRIEISQIQPFEFSTQRYENQIKVFCKGRLSEPAEEDFKTLFNLPVFLDVEQIRLVLDDSFSIDRSGIFLLMEVLQDLNKRSVLLCIENLSYNYARVFQMAGVDKLATLKAALTDE